MNRIYLLYNFNNYFNRKLIRYDTLAEYLNAVDNDYEVFDNVINFNPADGVNTEHIFNIGAYNINARTPNYMLVCEDNNEILQRWFVIEADRTRAGQYKVQLYRDTVAESFDEIKNSPIYVEKSVVPDTDSAIFNSEGITFNQIKMNQTLLKDDTKTPWIVGYITNEPLEKQTYSFDKDTRANINELDNLEQFEFYNYLETDSKTEYSTTPYLDRYATESLGTSNLYFNIKSTGPLVESDLYNYVFDTRQVTKYDGAGQAYTKPQVEEPANQHFFFEYFNNEKQEIDMAIANNNGYNADLLDRLKSTTFNVIYDKSSGKYYHLYLVLNTDGVFEEFVEYNSILGNKINELVSKANIASGFLREFEPMINDYSVAYSGMYINAHLLAEEVESEIIEYTISNNRLRPESSAYSIFAMPYFKYDTDEKESIHMMVAQDIAKRFGGETPKMYDLQLLPYAPVENYEIINNRIIPKGKYGIDYNEIINKNGEILGNIWWCKKDSVKKTIQFASPEYNVKIKSETEMYRICSPNWNGIFEFNTAKNKGLDAIVINQTAKPYQPYIHVAPKFGGLYGSDFNDARGLVCGGKFDLPQTSDSWATYERQNTNYNAIFNRQIENLEIQQDIQKNQEFWQAFAGTIQGAGTGAAVGSAGGPIGAAIGAVGGVIASGAAGVSDLAYSEKIRKEQKDYTIDMYNMNLRNIKAQPNSLVSVGALTSNNTYWPVLEYYKCTDEEVDALINKIKYNGMTIGRIGTINEFKNNSWFGFNYFKGKLIQADIPGEDWHYINTLKHELNEGVFLKWA